MRDVRPNAARTSTSAMIGGFPSIWTVSQLSPPTCEQSLLGVHGRRTSIKHCKTSHTKQKTQRPCVTMYDLDCFGLPVRQFSKAAEKNLVSCVFFRFRMQNADKIVTKTTKESTEINTMHLRVVSISVSNRGDWTFDNTGPGTLWRYRLLLRPWCGLLSHALKQVDTEI